MKKVNPFSKILFLCIVFACVATQSCKKDEEKNYMIFDGVRYDLSQGLLTKYGQYDPEDGHNFGLMLYSRGIQYSVSGNSWSGEGSFIYFEMYSEMASDLAPGTYVFEDLFGLAYKPFTFNLAFLGTDIDMGLQLKNELGDLKRFKQDVFHYLEEGNLRLGKNKSVYTINVDGITEESLAVKAIFEGPLMLVDATDTL